MTPRTLSPEVPSFGPTVAQTLADALIAEAAHAAGREWRGLRDELAPRLRALGDDAERAAAALRAGRITPEQARHLLHLQRLALGSILRHGRVLGTLRAKSLTDRLLQLVSERLEPIAPFEANQRL